MLRGCGELLRLVFLRFLDGILLLGLLLLAIREEERRGATRAALEEGANFEISTTEFGPMAPNGVDGVPYFEKLVQNAKYEYVDMEEAPDGEYVVLSFPDDNVRFDFFKADGSKNLIRQVTTTDGEEYSYYFQATLADESVQAADVMQEWYNALVEANK